MNIAEHIIPRCIQRVIVYEIVCTIFLSRLEELSSDTFGISITESELVIAHGNIISGRVIPDIIPYVLIAFSFVMPYIISSAGISIASPLSRRWTSRLLRLSGIA